MWWKTLKPCWEVERCTRAVWAVLALRRIFVKTSRCTQPAPTSPPCLPTSTSSSASSWTTSQNGNLSSTQKKVWSRFSPRTPRRWTQPKGQDPRTDGQARQTSQTPGSVFWYVYVCLTVHVKNTVAKAKTKVNVLIALVGSSWGQDKETLLTTTICRSTLEYAAPVWAPYPWSRSASRIGTASRGFKNKHRVATGCLLMSGTDHLHQECKVLPLKEHSQLLCKQYLAGTFLPAHPGNENLEKYDPVRKKNLEFGNSRKKFHPNFSLISPSKKH